MVNIYEILQRAASLKEETALNSISPERAGGIMYDTLLALNDLWLQQGSALVISKIYASVSAMEADTAPVSDLTGKPLRPGQIVVIASSDSDNGSVYRYNGTDAPSWSLVGAIGNLTPVDSLDSDSTTLPLAANQGKVLDGKISQLGQLSRGGKYFGVADPSTVPASTNINVFYFPSSPGIYKNFGNIEVNPGEFCVLYYKAALGSWQKDTFKNRISSFGYFYCETASSVADKVVSNESAPDFTLTPENTYQNLFLLHLAYKNTADDVTLNVASTGAKPLYYNGARMSSTNCPNYNWAYILVFYNSINQIYVGIPILYSADELGDSENRVITQKAITNIITQKETGLKDDILNLWKNTFHKPISCYQGYFASRTGVYTKSNTLIATANLYGYVRMKLKAGYVCGSGNIFNVDGTVNQGFVYSTPITEYYGWIEPYKYVRFNIRKQDGTDITPNDDAFEILDFQIDKLNIVSDHTRFNLVVKELYLKGADENKDYYISSVSKNATAAFSTSLVVREKESGDIVCRYYHAGQLTEFSSFVDLESENNSGIIGVAVIDWEQVNEGELITDANNYILLDKVKNVDAWPLISLYLKSPYYTIKSLTLVADDGVIHTAWNYILKDVTINGTRYLQFSDNLGKTYTQAENTYGDIVYVHFFSNGVCLFATANKCYYFSDISNIQESTLLDYDGSPYVSNCVLDFFQNDQSRNDAMFVNGREIVVWGNYSLGYTYDPNYIARVWYSPDYGQTVKCAIKFGTTEISGETTAVRHVHGALYNKFNQKFIIITGDAGNECQIIEGVYIPTTDSWQFTKLGQGDQFKFGDVLFRENFVYLVTDYTLSVADYPRGILRCPYEMLGDYSKYQYICKIDNYTGSLIGALEDDNGNKMLFPDGYGAGKIWYCKDNFNFVELPMSENVVITNVGSPNYNGEIYARKSQGVASFPFKLSPMVNLTKSMRESGCKDFFVQDNVLL